MLMEVTIQKRDRVYKWPQTHPDILIYTVLVCALMAGSIYLAKLYSTRMQHDNEL